MDNNHRWNDCPDCGDPKVAASTRCRACHMRRVHRRKTLKLRARDLVADWLDGCVIYLGPWEDMTRGEFVAVIADVVNST